MLFGQGKGIRVWGGMKWSAARADAVECMLDIWRLSCSCMPQALQLDRVYVSVTLQSEKYKQTPFGSETLVRQRSRIKKDHEEHLKYTHLLCRASSRGVCSTAPFQNQ